ncbi:hypothetical protein OGH69_17640 [Flavobacterium sp. MFBS3-15]|uniref:hypothetical protein n=1 Tax=Flavobacterium sp. MFBS3-15 TaxID=2989816 RepID=UPI002236A696|nr:hypothetical protein [Flavobacterium sp. MFBS3-15]MCW4470799.1 hypothetical protein [Flavobacterium sp. MFBS3-15]
MKNVYFFGLLLFLGCFAGYGQKKIVIEEFKDMEVSGFHGGTEITDANIRSFELHVLKEMGVEKVVIKNGMGGGSSPGQLDGGTGITRYKVENIPVLEGNICKIELIKGQDSKTITIKVKEATAPNGAAQSPAGTSTECTEKVDLFQQVKDCPDKALEDSFGLDPADFGKDDVIYVYDFNKVTSKRRMYKFTKNNDNDATFVKSKVNLTQEELRAKKQVWIKVANINRFMNDVSIADSLFYYNSKPSALFNRMFIGDSITTLGSMMDKAAIQSTKQNKVNDILTQLDCFNKMYTSLKAEMIKAFDPCQTFTCCNTVDFKTLSLKLNEIRTAISVLQLEYTDTKKELETLKKEKTDCAALVKDEKKLTEELAKLKNGDAGYDIAKEKVDKMKACKDDSPTRQTKIDQKEMELSIVNGLDEIKANLPTDAQLKQLSVFLLNMVEQNQALIKGPIQLEGNLLDVTININSRDSIVAKFGYPNFSDKIHFAIPVYGRPFVSFSSGSFLAPDKRLREKTYAWQEVNGAGHVLTESGYSNPVAGFSALVNVQWGLSSYVGLGPSVGVGLTIEEQPRLSYLVGGSLFLGKKSQLAITGGVAVMQVDRISKNFESAYESQTVFSETTPIDYYKELKVGPFISLTYTLFKISKSK